jgi:hypothetical protein
MIDLGNLAETLGLRRKKTVVERFQEAAEDVVETVVDSVMERVRPSKPSPMSRMARMGSAVRHIELPEVHMPEMRVPDLRLPDVKMPDVKLSDVKLPEMRLPDVRLPDLHAAEKLERATGKVKHGAAATGTAAAGVAAGIGGFFAAMFSGLWWFTTFLIKAAILGGVAYAGWQYLQSRKTQQSWSGSGTTGYNVTPGATGAGDSTYASSVYGSVSSPAPAKAGS